MTWRGWLDGELAQIRARDQWRGLRTFDAAGPEGRLGPDGGPVVSFASNDYLGLSAHPDVVAAARQALERWGTGSSSSRLVVGTRPVHVELEAALAEWKGTEAALLFPTGYAANIGVLSALQGADVTIFSDQLNHASIVDGCRLSRSEVVVYPHRDAGALGKLLPGTTGRAAVVSETVFSMDGDVAPVARLMDLCAQHHALLILDEAHAVLGPHVGGNGVGLDIPIDLDLILVGTLSKALGSLGGFVAGSLRWVEWLVNRARPFIFTTAPTPADSAAARAALRIVQTGEGEARLARLKAHIDTLRPGHNSPIIPIVVGSERHALDAARGLLDLGLLVPAIRPPTVPAGTSRLRIALSAAHTADQVSHLSAVLDDLGLGSLVAP
ncbi:MAG: 8-amino-7-oxononanoate synthase [Actinomycetota bacterium]|nr:8-amino-7-oxononanoate synthase [Actinomycetota bacterium]